MLMLGLTACRYSTYAGSFKQVECLRYVLEPLLYKYGVDVILNGHVHAYERSYKVRMSPDGPVRTYHAVLTPISHPYGATYPSYPFHDFDFSCAYVSCQSLLSAILMAACEWLFLLCCRPMTGRLTLAAPSASQSAMAETLKASALNLWTHQGSALPHLPPTTSGVRLHAWTSSILHFGVTDIVSDTTPCWLQMSAPPHLLGSAALSLPVATTPASAQ